MNEYACHLVDRVLPRAPYRQWVLTLPPELARAVAFDAPLARKVWRILAAELSRWYVDCGEAMGVDRAQMGCVMAVQRLPQNTSVIGSFFLAAPSEAEERHNVKLHGTRTAMPRLDDFGIQPVADRVALSAARAVVAGLTLADEVADYIVSLVRATRDHPSLLHGASPRAASMLATAARALAAIRGRDFVIPDDVKALFLAAMRRRVILSPGAEVEGRTTEGVLDQVLTQVSAPR